MPTPPLRTLIIDNHDSFTFNLYQMLSSLGGVAPRVVPNDYAPPAGWRALPFDNIVISPGPGRPERARDIGVCLSAIREARVPVLGVCLGHQAIAHAHGAAIEHASVVMHGRVSAIVHSGDPLFAQIPSPLSVVRYHSLLVPRALPAALEAIAWTEPDGLLMALRHRERPLWGVQFHPESICSEHGERLLKNFCELTRARARPRETIIDMGARDGGRPAARPARPGEFAVYHRTLSEPPDVERAFVGLYGGAARAFWLDSSMRAPGRARFSFIGDASGPHALEIQYRVDEQTATIRSSDERTTVARGDLFEILAAVLERRACASPQLPFDFNTGLVGYLGYELKRACGAQGVHRASTPDAQLLLTDRVIAFDHARRSATLVCLAARGAGGRAQAERWFERVERRLRGLPELPELPPPRAGSIRPKGHGFTLTRSRDDYLRDIARCLEHLREGESYELCLTNRLTSAARPDPLTYYRALRRRNPAPYAAYLRFGELAIASSSPERFLKITASGAVESRPIKGTVPRGRTPEEDDVLRESLRVSEKDRAENLMIVDLVRNDLGRVCEPGSVRVPQLMEVERYATVHQLESAVRGQLRADASALDCVRAAFPGGSMTGAPKLRTMELLDALEPEARGVYSGAIGFLSVCGAADLSIVIRTALMSPRGMSIGVGGAIVAQSTPEREFDEIMLKARALLDALDDVTAPGGV